MTAAQAEAAPAPAVEPAPEAEPTPEPIVDQPKPAPASRKKKSAVQEAQPSSTGEALKSEPEQLDKTLWKQAIDQAENEIFGNVRGAKKTSDWVVDPETLDRYAEQIKTDHDAWSASEYDRILKTKGKKEAEDSARWQEDIWQRLNKPIYDMAQQMKQRVYELYGQSVQQRSAIINTTLHGELEDALQEPSTASVLQREPGQDGATGRGRGRVEPGVEGTETTPARTKGSAPEAPDTQAQAQEADVAVPQPVRQRIKTEANAAKQAAQRQRDAA
jgi:hypothetical protein